MPQERLPPRSPPAINLGQLISNIPGETTTSAPDAADFNAERISRESPDLATLVADIHERLIEKEAAEAAARPPPVLRTAPARPGRWSGLLRITGLSQVAPGIIKWGLVIAVALVAIGTQLPKLLPHSQEFIREELAIILYQTRAEVELHRDKYGHITHYRPRSSIQSPTIGRVELHYRLTDNNHYILTAVSGLGEKMEVTVEGLAFPTEEPAPTQ